MYETPQGWYTIETICEALGKGPGLNARGAIPYNDVQCGHWGNDRGDEDSDTRCPGRVDVRMQKQDATTVVSHLI